MEKQSLVILCNWAEVTVVSVLLELQWGVEGKGICLYFSEV